MNRSKIAIFGADISAFHLFNRLYRSDDRYEVVCFFEFHHPINYENFQYLTSYPFTLSGDLYPQGINILHSYPYKQSYLKEHKTLDKCIFSPSAITSSQYLYSTAEFIAMDSSVVTHSLESTQLPPPKALISFFSNTQFDIPILLKILNIYEKTYNTKPVIAMPGPLHPFIQKNANVEPFFFVENSAEFESCRSHFKYRHELEMIDKIFENGYRIYFVYDFEEFNSECLSKDDFDIIVFVGFNLLPCFYQSHLVVFCCDDFTFGDNISAHSSYVMCQQADIIIYAHLGPAESSQKIANKVRDTNLICLQVSYKARNSNCYPNKTALLVDDSYPTHACKSNRSISQFLATSFRMKPFQSQDEEKSLNEIIYGAPSDGDWPAIVLPESEAGVTTINESLLRNLRGYDIIVSSTSSDCNLKPPSPIQVMQFKYEVNLENMKPNMFKLNPGAFGKQRKK